MADVTLTGLEGTNPLSFLAALGVLDAVGEEVDARLSWRYDGGWRPVLVSSHDSFDTLIARLAADRESCVNDPALALTYEGKRDLKPPPAAFREYLSHLVSTASASQRRSIDWASAFATDVAVDNKGNIKPTAMHFTAGNQQFLKMAIELAANVTTDDLHEAVAGPWRYVSELPVLGWDATSSRDYALRASNPSTDEKHGVPGADWLALRGLAYLPTVPGGMRIHTTGCKGSWKGGHFHWPLWTVALAAPVVRTLLTQDVQGMAPPERRARGIGAVFSSGIRRSDQGGYGSFEPATPA